jgi:hypothetical protein
MLYDAWIGVMRCDALFLPVHRHDYRCTFPDLNHHIAFALVDAG